MAAEVRDYRWFIGTFAPLGYARLFARLGDFFRAQGALERALLAGHEGWEAAPRDARPALDAALMLSLAEGVPVEDLREPAPPSTSSFARSVKLNALQQVIELVRTFSEREQTALVLLTVEEIPEARVAEWLGLDTAAIGTLRARLAARLEELDVQTPADEDRRAFFARAMRNHRLPASFVPAVINRLPPRREPVPAAPEAVYVIGGLVSGVLLMIFLAGERRYYYGYAPAPPDLMFELRFFLDLAVWASCLFGGPALRTVMERLRPSSLFAGAIPTLIGLCAAVGWPFLIVNLLFVTRAREPGRYDAWHAYAFLHYLWVGLAACLTIASLFKLLTVVGEQPGRTP